MPPKIENPVISFVMPIKDRVHLIAEVLDSIFKQTIHDWELIIVNDNSTDDLKDLLPFYAADERIGYINLEKSVGVATARNIGNSLGRSKYIGVVDSDDLYAPERARLSIEGLKKYDLLFGSYYVADSRGVPIELIEAEEIDWKRFKKEHYTAGGFTLAYKRNKVLQTPYQWGLRFDEDRQLILDFKKKGYKIGFTKEVLGKMRLQREGLSMTRGKVLNVKRS